MDEEIDERRGFGGEVGYGLAVMLGTMGAVVASAGIGTLTEGFLFFMSGSFLTYVWLGLEGPMRVDGRAGGRRRFSDLTGRLWIAAAIGFVASVLVFHFFEIARVPVLLMFAGFYASDAVYGFS